MKINKKFFLAGFLTMMTSAVYAQDVQPVSSQPVEANNNMPQGQTANNNAENALVAPSSASYDVISNNIDSLAGDMPNILQKQDVGSNKASADYQAAMIAYLHHDYDGAFKKFEKAARKGNIKAQSALGRLYATGDGIAKNNKKSIFWLEKASRGGDIHAEHSLALMYLNGQGIRKNRVHAVYWFKKAANKGNSAIQWELGTRYATGNGVPKSLDKAAYWYDQAAGQGNAAMAWELGRRYSTGYNVPRNPDRAAFWYGQAASNGNPSYQWQLGTAYANGDGVPKDPIKAETWLERAALQGDLSQEIKLANLYSEGDVIPQDMSRSVFWAQRVVNSHMAPIGYYLLADAYAVGGQGLQQDKKKARTYYDQACKISKDKSFKKSFHKKICDSAHADKKKMEQSK